MGLSFLKGLVAAVNPCAFVLLPTYLAYFLGTEGGRPGDQRSTVRRALVVSGALTAGFMAVFVVVGIASEYVTSWLENNAKYATLVIGAAFVVLGLAMLTGRRLPIGTPRFDPGAPDRTVTAMAVYGVAYAVTSISCTLPLFVTTLFGNVRSGGWGSGVANVVAYGAGMALVVSALTITLAVANTSLLGAMRRGSRHVDRVAAVLVVVSGVYLLWYFWVVDVNEERSFVTDRVDTLQRRILSALNDHWQLVAVALAAIVLTAAAYAFGRHTTRSDTRTVSESARATERPTA